LSKTDLPGDDRNGRTPDASPESAWTDPELLLGVRRRDRHALERFFDLAFPYVYNLAFRLTGSRETAEDVTQDVFVKVYQAADRLQTDRNPKPWLSTITYNTCRDMARRRAVRPETLTDSSAIGERYSDPSTPEDVLLRKEREMLTERALMALDEDSRTVIILHDLYGSTHPEIAGIMGLSHEAVRKRYSRALKSLAELIKGMQ
jgi:RNA polymerase sigma-70 factor (ECF subfamily)